MHRYISLLLFIGLAFWSCEEEKAEVNPLIGTWTMTSRITNYTGVFGPGMSEMDTVFSAFGDSEQMILEDSGVYNTSGKWDNDFFSESGTWNQNGDSLIFFITETGNTKSYEYSIEGNNLTTNKTYPELISETGDLLQIAHIRTINYERWN